MARTYCAICNNKKGKGEIICRQRGNDLSQQVIIQITKLQLSCLRLTISHYISSRGREHWFRFECQRFGVLSADSQSGTVQTLSISGNTITLSDSGGSVTVPDLDTQDLSISGRTISLTNGGSVSVPASSTEDFTTARKTR